MRIRFVENLLICIGLLGFLAMFLFSFYSFLACMCWIYLRVLISFAYLLR